MGTPRLSARGASTAERRGSPGQTGNRTSRSAHQDPSTRRAIVSLVLPDDDDFRHDAPRQLHRVHLVTTPPRSPTASYTPSPENDDPEGGARGSTFPRRAAARGSAAHSSRGSRDLRASFAKKLKTQDLSAGKPKPIRYKHADTAAQKHFRRATQIGARLDTQGDRTNAVKTDQLLAAEMSKNFERVAHLTEELDGLFAEMGRQTAVLRAGHHSQLRLIPGITRTIEVKLPRAREDGEETTVQVECRCDPQHHYQDEEGRRRGLLPEGNFDVCVAETQRQVPDGPFRAQSLRKTVHRLRFNTDNISIFVCFFSKQQCHMNFVCRVWQGLQTGTQALDRTALRESINDDDDDQPIHLTASVGQKLQAKLKHRRQDLAVQQANEESLRKDSEEIVAAAAAAAPIATISPVRVTHRFLHFAEYLWDGQKPPRDEQQIINAKKRLMNTLLGPCNKWFTKFKRAKGTWVKSLSAECPRKLIRWLRKAVQDREALTILAVVGGFSFFLRRQRDLHLMRARAALRQLVWYKVLFAASRLRYAMVFCARSREEALTRARERTFNLSISAGRGKANRDDSDSDSDTPVEDVRRYVNLFAKMHPGPGTSQRLATGGGQAVQSQKPQGSNITSLPDAPSSALVTDVQASERLQRRNQVSSLEAMGTSTSRHRRRWVSEDALLEWRLASQGFLLHPQPDATGHGHGHGHGPRRDQGNLSSRTQQQDFLNTLSDSLGRAILPNTPPPLDSEHPNNTTADDDHDGKHSKAMHEVHERTLLITVRPEEIGKLRDASPCRVQQIGSNNFKTFFQQSAHRAAESLVRRRNRQAKVERGDVPMKIHKRYLLQFFEEEQAELPWLPLMQSLMLVILGQTAFQTPHEHYIFDTKLRGFKEARKVAMRRPGLFQPVEAALWSHPVILSRAARLQRSMTRGDGALAWKSSLFEGCYEESSDRDPTGATLVTFARTTDPKAQLLRKLAEVSGQFAVDTTEGEPPALAAELTPAQQPCLAMKTSSGYPVRSFGDVDGSPRPDCVIRQPDDACNLPHDIVPRDLRIENIRRKRRAKASLSGPRDGHELIANSDLQAQQRYAEWMMRTDVPAKSQRFKSQMQPFFEGLVAADAPTFSAPPAAAAIAKAAAAQRAAAQERAKAAARANRVHRTPASDRSYADEEEDEKSIDPEALDTGGEAGVGGSRVEIAVVEPPPGPAKQSPRPSSTTKSSSVGPQALMAALLSRGSKRQVGSAHIGLRSSAIIPNDLLQVEQQSDGSGSNPSTRRNSTAEKKEEESSELTPGGSAFKHGLTGRAAASGPTPPQTAEEVGRLFKQSDALQTILSIDASEIGGFAHRCPAGWNSGYRVEPMSKDEIRKARIVEKFSSSKNFARVLSGVHV